MGNQLVARDQPRTRGEHLTHLRFYRGRALLCATFSDSGISDSRKACELP